MNRDNSADTAAVNSIGVLNETSVHSFLKTRMDADVTHHEVKRGRHIADVANENGVYEIQTRGFYRIRGKLEDFLREGSVTLVYPVTVRKTLYWIDPETGDCSPGRKTGKRCTVCEIWKELPSVVRLLEHPGFSIRLILLEAEEYRALDGFGPQKKYRASHIDRCPVKIVDEVDIRSPEDYPRIIPTGLTDKEEPFSSLDFAKAGHIPRKAAQDALRILNDSGFVHRVSHDRSGYRYRFTDSADGSEASQ